MTSAGIPPGLPQWPGRSDEPVAEHQPSSVKAKIALVLGCVVAGVLLALVAGWVWVAVADPPAAELTAEGGVFFGEAELDRQVGVTLWFIVVTLVFGIVSGLAVAWRSYRHGLGVVLAILAMSIVGSWLTSRFGQDLFGADPQAQLETAKPGDLITGDVSLGTRVAYLGWPIGGMIGAMAGVSGWPKRERRLSMAPVSSSLGPQSSSSHIS